MRYKVDTVEQGRGKRSRESIDYAMYDNETEDKAGIYIVQNTMGRGGGWSAGEKNEKGERKKEEITLKRGKRP